MLTWLHTDPAIEQKRLIEAWVRGGVTVTWLAREFGLSRKTVYKRIDRFRAYGLEGLGDLSRAPHTHPNRTPQEVADLVVDVKQKHMTWGPKKVVAWLEAHCPDLSVPSASTAGEVLLRAGLVLPRRRRHKAAPWSQPFAHVSQPNDTWCADLKGWFRTKDGQRLDPLTITDCLTRFCIACTGLERPNLLECRRAMEDAFRLYGLPHTIRTDNGSPFASTGLGGLTQLSAWWVKLGITPERIAPGHPEQNGRHERFHRTLKAETASPPHKNLKSQQRAFDSFRAAYNSLRPHEALGQRTPQSAYSPSPRRYPEKVRPPEYDSNVTVRRVRSNGEIKWRGDFIYLSEALRGEPVALEQRSEHLWAIRFGPLEIGTLDQRTRKVLHTPVKVLPMSPV